MAQPVTDVTMGVWVWSMVGISRLTCHRIWRCVSPARGLSPPPPRCDRSKPEQKCSPVPDRRMTRTDSSRPGDLDQFDQREHHVVGDGVAAIGPIEAQPEDRAVARRESRDLGAGRRHHRAPPPCRRSGRPARRGRRPGGRPAGRVGQSHRTVLAARQQDRGVAGHVTSPRWFSPQMSRSTAGRSPSARYLRVTRPPHPVGVADVVELAELDVERGEPGVVAHPVGAQVHQPRLAHPAVVVDRRVAGPPGPLGIPVHALLHVGDVQLVGSEEPGTRWRCW